MTDKTKAELKAELKTAKESNINLSKRIIEMGEENDILQNALKEMHAQIDSAEKRIAEIESSLEEAKHNRQALLNAIAQLKKAADLDANSLKLMTAQRDGLQEKCVEDAKEIAELKRQRDNAARMADQIRKSADQLSADLLNAETARKDALAACNMYEYKYTDLLTGSIWHFLKARHAARKNG